MKKVKNNLLIIILVLSIIVVFLLIDLYKGFQVIVPEDLGQSRIEDDLPFKPGEAVSYKVKFNGIYVGDINWEYLGRANAGDKLTDVLSLSSDIKILKLFSIKSKDKLFIDSKTYLPFRIEREVNFLGKHESIIEEYNQEEGYVKISNIGPKGRKEKIIRLEAPIHNAIALFYFHPKEKELDLGVTSYFTLPTQEISIKVSTLEMLDTATGEYEVYLLKGKPRNFKLWLEKEKRVPLRIEFPVFLGKIVISRVD
ncbi:MAG: DUF3108 domain-containing protein [Candidatus Omnitrophica bacterium]|nr:DUF3108 domain-containing protein [Candidatus Omnitrophota bacterium]